MTLRDDIHANPACADALAAKDCIAIAEIMSGGRMQSNTREIGNGTILEVLGLAAGNAFLDVINGSADFRYVKPLIEQGRLLIGSPLAQSSVQSMVPDVLTQAQADALCAIGLSAHPYTTREIAAALFNDDGTEK